MQKGGWGTVDDLYLYQTKSADKSDADNGNTGDDENRSRIPHLLMIITRTIQVAVIPTKMIVHQRMTIQPMVIGIAIQETVMQPHSLQRLLHREQLYQAHPTLKTAVRTLRGILPDTVKFESKVTDGEVAKVADVVKDKIVGVRMF